MRYNLGNLGILSIMLYNSEFYWIFLFSRQSHCLISWFLSSCEVVNPRQFSFHRVCSVILVSFLCVPPRANLKSWAVFHTVFPFLNLLLCLVCLSCGSLRSTPRTSFAKFLSPFSFLSKSYYPSLVRRRKNIICPRCTLNIGSGSPSLASTDITLVG